MTPRERFLKIMICLGAGARPAEFPGTSSHGSAIVTDEKSYEQVKQKAVSNKTVE